VGAQAQEGAQVQDGAQVQEGALGQEEGVVLEVAQAPLSSPTTLASGPKPV